MPPARAVALPRVVRAEACRDSPTGSRWLGAPAAAGPPSGRAGLGQVGVPLRVAVVAGPDQPPVGAARDRGHAQQRPAQFLDQAVGLAVIAGPAGRDAVLPGVTAATAARDD